MNGERVRVLLVCANPRGTDLLRTDREERVLREAIQLSRYNDSIEVVALRAATVDDLRRALLVAKYDIVHFSGHGTRRGLVFEDEAGRLMVPRTEALARLLERRGVETALLNACYSLDVGEVAPIGTKYTIVMDGPIADAAAVEFSRGFYDAIGNGDDVPTAFREGVDCAELKNLSVSAMLLPDSKGYAAPVRQSFETQHKVVQHAADDGVSETKNQKRLLLGIALDVSGSMQESIGGSTSESRTRLQSAKEALRRLSEPIASWSRGGRPIPIDEERVRIFAYCFGTRIAPGYDDLLGTMLAVRQLDVPAEIEKKKRKYEEEARRRYSAYSGLESLARDFLGGSTVARVEGALRAGAEKEIRERITSEIVHLIRDCSSRMQRPALTIKEFSEIFDGARGANLKDFEALVYGSTPLRVTAEQIVAHFRSIPATPGCEEARLLLVVSDGQPTDGDPLPHFKALKDAGVVIVSCYVTNADVADPRVLLGQSDEHWDPGARLMFDAASVLDERGEFAGFLLRNGWTIEKSARMFVQVNHSDVLEEFVSALGSQMRQQEEVGLLPIGR